MTEIEQLVARNYDVIASIKLAPHGYVPMYAMSAKDEQALEGLGYMVLDGYGCSYRLTDLGRALVHRLVA